MSTVVAAIGLQVSETLLKDRESLLRTKGHVRFNFHGYSVVENGMQY
jgi:hypothetical protein